MQKRTLITHAGAIHNETDMKGYVEDNILLKEGREHCISLQSLLWRVHNDNIHKAFLHKLIDDVLSSDALTTPPTEINNVLVIMSLKCRAQLRKFKSSDTIKTLLALTDNLLCRTCVGTVSKLTVYHEVTLTLYHLALYLQLTYYKRRWFIQQAISLYLVTNPSYTNINYHIHHHIFKDVDLMQFKWKKI